MATWTAPPRPRQGTCTAAAGCPARWPICVGHSRQGRRSGACTQRGHARLGVGAGRAQDSQRPQPHNGLTPRPHNAPPPKKKLPTHRNSPYRSAPPPQERHDQRNQIVIHQRQKHDWQRGAHRAPVADADAEEVPARQGVGGLSGAHPQDDREEQQQQGGEALRSRGRGRSGGDGGGRVLGARRWERDQGGSAGSPRRFARCPRESRPPPALQPSTHTDTPG